MVGVPGRSKGCSTCRAKKKGCDRQFPSCGQCTKANLVCGGYSREPVWVNAKQGPHRVNATYSASEPLGDGSLRDPDASTVALHDSLAQSAREQKYVGLYWTAYLPNGRPMNKTASSLSSGGWITYIDTLYQAEPSLRYVMLAMSSSLLGGKDANSQLRVKGLQTYLAAVKEMAIAVDHEKRVFNDGLLAAVRMMGSYEVLFGWDADEYTDIMRTSQIDGWYGHTQGEMALTKLRGPGSFTSGPGHQLFVDGRMNAITNAITWRRRCPLASPEWKTIPWTGRQKTLKDKLLDIAVDLPGYLGDVDTIHACDNVREKETKRSELMERCKDSERHLMSWEVEAASKIRRFDYTVTGAPVPPLERDEDLALLHLASFYWAMSIQLCSVVDTLLDTAAPSPDRSSSQQRMGIQDDEHENLGLPRRLEADDYARRIAHCVHLFFEPQAGGLGASLAFLPFGVALYYFEKTEAAVGRQSPELAMLQSLFGRPFLGTYVGRFLQNLRGRIIPSQDADV